MTKHVEEHTTGGDCIVLTVTNDDGLWVGGATRLIDGGKWTVVAAAFSGYRQVRSRDDAIAAIMGDTR